MSANNTLPIACLYPPQGHQVKNMKAGTMLLITAWVGTEESYIYPAIPFISGDTKGIHRLNSLNNIDYTITITITRTII